jgi:hypothetical protein
LIERRLRVNRRLNVHLWLLKRRNGVQERTEIGLKWSEVPVNFVALKMLVADRSKYFGLIFTIAFASFLLANQIGIFIGIMTRPASQIRDVVDADIWVMDSQNTL